MPEAHSIFSSKALKGAITTIVLLILINAFLYGMNVMSPHARQHYVGVVSDASPH